MKNIIQDFCEVFNIQNEVPKTTQHLQLTGSKNERTDDNVKIMLHVFCSHEMIFEKADILCNV